jgi:aminoglycoside 3-N-acetyltransferase
MKMSAGAIPEGELFTAIKDILCEKNTPILIHASGEYLNNAGVKLADFNQLITACSRHRTILMPTFPFEGLALHGIEETMFDLKRTPSKMGMQTEIFRRSFGVKRSLHPTHPVAAIGALAEDILDSHHQSIYPFASDSPFGRLDAFDGQIMLLGVGLSVLTHVHVSEDHLGSDFPVDVYLEKVFRVPVANSDVSNFVETRIHNPQVSRSKNIEKLRPFLLQKNALEERNVGGTMIQVLSASRTTDTILELAGRGITIYE